MILQLVAVFVGGPVLCMGLLAIVLAIEARFFPSEDDGSLYGNPLARLHDAIK